VTKLPEQFASTPIVRKRMQAIRGAGTKPELAVRRLVHAMGLRYRVDRRPLATLNRRADLVFTRAKVAVFVDGCFWHGCPEHGNRRFRVNEWYWPEKIQRNMDRDAETNRLLGEAGWHVVRAWEHDDPEAVARSVAEAVRARSAGTGADSGR
jgi:DNA mismatch endonuclease (patch repair protein)